MMFKGLLLLFLFPLCAAAQSEQHVAGFGGVDNFRDSMMIADTDAQSAVNVLTDEGDLRTIYGNTLYSVVGSSTISFLKEWINSSGQRVLFVQAGYNLYATDPTSGTITSIKYFGADRNLDMVAAFNRAYFTDETSGAFYSTGSSATTSPGFEDCKYVEYYQTRLACVNTSTETSKVILSAYNSATDWTTTSSKDSAAVKYFKKDDGESINCVFSTPEGLFIGKNSSVGMLKGSDNETFYWYYIANDVGCTDDRSVQIIDGKLIWLTREGFYSYDFAGVPERESIKISSSTKQIRRSDTSDSVWTVNTMSNWQDGTGDGWEYDIVPGSIKAEAYNSGALTAAATRYVRMFEDAGFERGVDTNWGTAFTGVSTMRPDYFGGPAPFGSYMGYDDVDALSATASIEVLNAADSVMIASATLSAEGWYNFDPITGSGNVKVRLTNRIGGTHTSIAFDRVLGARVYYIPTTQSVVGEGYYDIFDAVELGVASTTVVSVSTDSAFMAPVYSAELKGGNAFLNFYASADNSTFISTRIALTGSSVTIPTDYNKRYYKYSVTMSSGVSISSFTSLTLSVLSTTAYTSAVHAIPADISAWKLFTVSDSGTATPIYSVRTATYTFAEDAASPAFITQPKNATVVASTGTSIQFRINPNIATSTDALTVNSISIAYSVGQLSPRAASVVDDHRYIASVSHNSATANDITYIWQKNKEWTFSDQGYGALGLFNGQPMGGSADSASKLWYILDPLAYSFDGTAISSEWVTKDFSFAKINNHKVLNRFWVTAENNGVSNLGVAWQADRDGVWHSTTTSLASSSFIVREVEGLLDDTPLARQFRFKFSAAELSKYFRLKLFSVYFTENPLIK